MLHNDIKIICEIASAHCGIKNKLINLIDEGHNSGADFIKIQIFDYNYLIAKNSKTFLDLKKIEISRNDWKSIFNYCHKKNINLIAEPFDIQSLEMVRDYSDIKQIKIPTSDLGDWEYVKLVCEFAKIVIVGLGGAYKEEIEEITTYLKKQKNIEIVLMHGFQNFPTKLEDLQLSKIKCIIDNFNLKTGFADHINADFKELSRTIPCMAISLGAEYIEKHITLNRADREYDYYSALNPDEFKSFVSFVKDTYKAIGQANSQNLSNAEKKYRNMMKKFAVLNNNVLKGQSLTNDDVEFRRVDEVGFTRNQLNKLSIKKFNKDYPIGTVLNENCFK